MVEITERKYIDDNGTLVIEKIIEKETIIYVKEKKKSEYDYVACHNYYMKNKEEIKKNTKEYRYDRYKNDPEYREKIKQRQREYHKKKREKLQKNSDDNEDIKIIEIEN